MPTLAPKLPGRFSENRSLEELSTLPVPLACTVRLLSSAASLNSIAKIRTGNFGQANYSAAKMGLIAYTKTLAREGAKYGIQAVVIAPMAASAMTETIMPPEMLANLKVCSGADLNLIRLTVEFIA